MELYCYLIPPLTKINLNGLSIQNTIKLVQKVSKQLYHNSPTKGQFPNNSKCHQQENKQIVTFTDNEILLSNAKYEKLITGRTWVHYKDIVLSSRRQTQNSIYCMCSLERRAEMMEIFYILIVVLITEL